MAPDRDAGTLPWTTASVVVIEDSSTIRSLVIRMLAAGGHTVAGAGTGASGIDLCRSVSPDVVLLDVEMPGMSGWEVLAAMKADPELADVPVVFLTGRSATDDMVEGLRLGAHDYVTKPCQPAELLARVNAAARVKRLQDELRRSNDEMRAISRTDALTGLSNRRHADEQLAAMVSLAQRNAVPAAVLLIDIDHFKLVNDVHGHAAGDAVLREVAARLAAGVRLEDVVGRWGGEEFLALLPMTGIHDAGRLAERLRAGVAGGPYSLPDGGTLQVTVSIGAAAGPAEGAEALLRVADTAMYEAKTAGRNRVVSAGTGTSVPAQATAPHG